MAHGPYWEDLPVDANGRRYVVPTKWNQLVDNILNWQADRDAGGYGLNNLGHLSFGNVIGRTFAIYEGASGANRWGFSTASNPYRMQFFANAAEAMVLTMTGRVGIGVADPKSKLHVVGLPNYADNAAAIAAGLTAGAFYHSDGALKVVI